jgi:hypothetical protein
MKSLIEEKFDRIKIFRETRLITEFVINFIIPLIFLALLAFVRHEFFSVVPLDNPSICWVYFLTAAPFR